MLGPCTLAAAATCDVRALATLSLALQLTLQLHPAPHPLSLSVTVSSSILHYGSARVSGPELPAMLPARGEAEAGTDNRL